MKLKADFHIHTKGDPRDKLISHTVFDIIDKAKDNNFDVLSITHHREVCFSAEIKNYAESKGILLIPGVEIEIGTMHIIILNPPSFEISNIKDFAELKKFKEGSNALVVAPHPFFPGPSCLNSKFFEHRGLFDAVEFNGVYINRFNFNNKLEEKLKGDRLPIIGGSDTHFLSQFGMTYTLIEAEKNIDSILNAIRRNQVEVVSQPLSIRRNGLFTVGIFFVCGALREFLGLFKKYILDIIKNRSF